MNTHRRRADPRSKRVGSDLTVGETSRLRFVLGAASHLAGAEYHGRYQAGWAGGPVGLEGKQLGPVRSQARVTSSPPFLVGAS